MTTANLHKCLAAARGCGRMRPWPLLLCAALLVPLVLAASAEARPNGICGVYSPGIRLPADAYCEDEEGRCVAWERESDVCVLPDAVPPLE